MKSLDTNIVLRLLLGDVPAQSSQIEQLIAQSGQEFAVADYVFAEVVWILQGPAHAQSRDAIAANIETLVGLPQINCNRAMLQKAVPLYVAHPTLSFVDVCLAVYAELNNDLPLLTYDKKLAAKLPKLVQLVK